MTVSREILEILERLVSYRTTEDNPEEMREAFEYIISLFDPKIFRTRLFERNGKYSLLVWFDGNDAMLPRVLLNGHCDVVPADDLRQYVLRVEGNRAFGRGTCDMKGMLAVYIAVMQELAAMENRPNAALLINGDEEIGGENGVEWLAKEVGLRPGFVLCGDMYEDELQIITKEKGGLEIELAADGRSAHAAELWKGDNAIEKLMRAVGRIKRFVGKVEPEAWKTTVNLAIIETSNRTFNKVPADARAVLDIRFTEELAQATAELLLKIQALVPEVKVRVLGMMSPFFASIHDPRIGRLKEIAEKISGSRIPAVFEGGASDMRHFSEVGVHGVIFGCIGDNGHAKDEWVDLESLETQRRITREFLKSSS